MNDELSNADLIAFEIYLDAQLRSLGGLRQGGQAGAARPRAGIFIDVKPSEECFDFVNMMFTAGLTVGHVARPPQFCPNEIATREEMAAFLAIAAEGGRNFRYTAEPYFTDIGLADPYYKFIQRLEDLGITDSCASTQFYPDEPVTRGETAAFIITARYGTTPYTYPAAPYFSDVPPSHPHFPFIQKMAQAGIAREWAPGLYGPDQTITRGEVAILIVTGVLNQLRPSAAVIARAVPETASPGQALTVTLTGVNTHFAQGATQVATAPGIRVSDIVVDCETRLRVHLAVAATFVPKPTSIVVTTGAEEAVLSNRFSVRL